MMSKTLASLALAAACLAAAPLAYAQTPDQMVTNGPQASPGDNSPTWSARQNVRESSWYDHLLETNRGFREARMRRECGPINDPQLHANCVASFSRDEPMYGSSAPREPLSNEAGQ